MKKFIIFIIIMILFQGCNTQKIENNAIYLPNEDLNKKYVYTVNYGAHSTPNTFITQVKGKKGNCLELEEVLVLGTSNKLSDKQNYLLCVKDNLIIKKSDAGESIVISDKDVWETKVFKYYKTAPTDYANMSCKLLNTDTKKLFGIQRKTIHIQCKYDSQFREEYIYAAGIGMIEKVIFANDIKILEMKLVKII